MFYSKSRPQHAARSTAAQVRLDLTPGGRPWSGCMHADNAPATPSCG